MSVIATLEGHDLVLTNDGGQEVVTYTAKADIDGDGANGQNGKKPAYNDTNTGLDFLANGGMKIENGQVVGAQDFFKDVVVVENGRPKVFPGGVIVSMTAYKVQGEPENTPNRYLDAATIPYVVVPPVVIQKTVGVVRGCRARVSFNGKSVEAMVGDVGPSKKVGEISIATADALGIPSSPKSGGVSSGVHYEIFPGQKFTFNGHTFPLMKGDGTYV